MIFVPSRGRPDSLKRLLEHCAGTRGMLLLDNDDHRQYNSLEPMQDWDVHVEDRQPISARINKAMVMWPDMPWYGLMFDDLEPRAPGWHATMVEACMKKGIAWPDDEHEHRSTIPFVRGDIARAAGFLACPVVKHLFIDTFWGDLAEVLKINGYTPEVKIKHHWDLNDKTHNERQDANDDGAYYTFKKNELPDIARRIAPLLV